MAHIKTIHLNKEEKVVLTPDSIGSGHGALIGNPGEPPSNFQAINPGVPVTYGPYNTTQVVRLTVVSGNIEAVVSFAGTDATSIADLESDLEVRASVTQAPNLLADDDADSPYTIDSADGSFHKIIFSDATTLAFTFPTGKVLSILLEMQNAGSVAVTFPASMKWVGGVVPTFTATGTDLLTILQDGNNNLYGLLVGLDVKAV